MLYKNTNFYLAMTFILISIYMFVSAMDMPSNDAQFPIIIAVALFLFSAALLIQTIKTKKDDSKLELNVLKRICLLLTTMILYTLLINIMGYLISSVLLYISIFLIMGYRKLITGIISALVVVPVIFVVFKYFLNVPLPEII